MLLTAADCLANGSLDVLIVDRRPEDYIAWAVESPYGVAICESAAAALRLPLRNSALWLIEADLPDASGIELYQQLATRRGRAAAMVVANQYDARHEVAALACGLQFVCKPLDFTQLNAWCDELHARRPLAPQPFSRLTFSAAGSASRSLRQ